MISKVKRLCYRALHFSELKASNDGERIVINNFKKASDSNDFTDLAHISRYKWVVEYLNGNYCLDVGCGSGYGTNYLSKNGVEKIVGIDSSFNAIKYCNKKYKSNNLVFKHMNALDIHFKDNIFDTVISFDVLEHISESQQKQFVCEINRVLKDNGVLVIGCPNKDVSTGKNPFHLNELTCLEFYRLLSEYFNDVNLFGQDMIVNGIKQKQNWFDFVSDISSENLIITHNDVDSCFGLLAVCRKGK